MYMTRGDQLRAAIEAEYDVEGVAAASLVEEVVRTADELDAMEQALTELGPIIDGARGQKVANPAAALVVRHRKLLADLLHAAFPGDQETATELARRAARARWKK
jgi:hypothetical protein